MLYELKEMVRESYKCMQSEPSEERGRGRGRGAKYVFFFSSMKYLNFAHLDQCSLAICECRLRTLCAHKMTRRRYNMAPNTITGQFTILKLPTSLNIFFAVINLWVYLFHYYICSLQQREFNSLRNCILLAL